MDESGQVQVSLRLVQHGRVVAEGNASWSLRPKTEWILVVSRGIVLAQGGDNYTIEEGLWLLWVGVDSEAPAGVVY